MWIAGGDFYAGLRKLGKSWAKRGAATAESSVIFPLVSPSRNGCLQAFIARSNYPGRVVVTCLPTNTPQLRPMLMSKDFGPVFRLRA